MKTKKIIRRIFITILILCAILVIAYDFVCKAKKIINPIPLEKRTSLQEKQLETELNKKFPERTSYKLTPLLYDIKQSELSINAESAILVDVATGSILYEKNADQIIPPASMTKLVEMYVIFEAVENKEVTLDDIVPLPPQSWSENLPYDASRMYLGKNQIVTLRELLLGLSISSGNDASIAAANYICGNMQDFVDRMNAVVQSLGLTKTHFVESSGYSEENKTTAREFATFARVYIQKYPQALRQFHSRKMIKYPLQKNLSQEQKHLGDSLAIAQYNTNKLLDIIPGCDGLKTGFINESGYNIVLTAEQKGTRFLSVTMRGPGSSTSEGNKYRIADGKTLFNYSFDNFADYTVPKATSEHEYTVAVAGFNVEYVKLVPALQETFTVPFIKDDSLQINSPQEAVLSVKVNANFPSCLQGEVYCGTQYGELTYTLGDTVLKTIPLVADRDVAKQNSVSQAYGKVLKYFVNYLQNNFMK